MTNPQLTSYSVVTSSESILLKIWNRTRMSTLTTFVKHSFGLHSNQRILKEKDKQRTCDVEAKESEWEK